MHLLITFGEDNRSTSIVLVAEVPETLEDNQRTVEAPEGGATGRYILDDGDARLMTDEERTAELQELRVAALNIDNRRKRNALLAECDWTQLADTALTESEVQAWSDYRAELRALPEHTEWPELDELDWPTAP